MGNALSGLDYCLTASGRSGWKAAIQRTAMPRLHHVPPLGLPRSDGAVYLKMHHIVPCSRAELTPSETSSHHAQTNIAKPTMAPRLPRSATAVSIVISTD